MMKNMAGNKAIKILYTVIFLFSIGVSCFNVHAENDEKLLKERRAAYKNLRKKDLDRRLSAAEWISRNPKGLEHAVILKALKKENNGRIKHFLLEALRKNPAPEAVPVLFRLMNDESRKVRQDVAYNLRVLKPERGEDKLAKAFRKEKDHRVRVALVYAIGAYRTGRAFKTLHNALKDKKEKVVIQAAKELRSFNTDKADGILIGLKNRENDILKQVARDAKKRIRQRARERKKDKDSKR